MRQRVDDVKNGLLTAAHVHTRGDAGSAETLEANHSVPSARGLDVRFACKGRPSAVVFDQVLRLFVKAGTDAGIGKVGTHSMRHTLPILAWRSGHACRSTAEAHAARRHPHHHSEWESNPFTAEWIVKTDCVSANSLKTGGSERESNPPSPPKDDDRRF